MYFNQFSPILCCILIGCCLIGGACSDKQSTKEHAASDSSVKASEPIFKLLSSDSTGVHFANNVVEDEVNNYMTYDAFYLGGGVGIADLNNDDLPELFFTGNTEHNELYKNNGNLRFESITESAGIAQDDRWSGGVSFADVNQDGLLDIYVCNGLYYQQPDRRKNQLYINLGNLKFEESAEAFGLADSGYSIHSTFFDYDNDGDYDLYVVNQPPAYQGFKKEKRGIINKKYTDRLYRNDRNNRFTDVTKESGIENFAYGLSITAADLNEDGLTDLYVACDYVEPDFFYVNNGDGTFSEQLKQSVGHTSNFSMGSDIADVNNDGLSDIFVVDMVAEDNRRLKTNMSGMNPEKFWWVVDRGYHYQYMSNALQLNRGDGKFSEIAQMAGVSNTDWSWSALLADFNLDGYRDALVTNGLKRDVRDNDYLISKRKRIESMLKDQQQVKLDVLSLLDMAPSVKLKNYVFENMGDLTFDKRSDQWGLSQTTWSQGAAHADLDGDGDLDLVVNNMDEKAFVYKNTTIDQQLANWLKVQVFEDDGKTTSLNAKLELIADDYYSFEETKSARGYMSSSDPAVIFGLGETKQIDQLNIVWSDGSTKRIDAPKINTTLRVDKKSAVRPNENLHAGPKLFTRSETSIKFRHRENKFNDFDRETLLPHKMSTFGPAIATADVNGDGLIDVFAGGAQMQAAGLFLNVGTGFVKSSSAPWKAHKNGEDAEALFFDANNDTYPDLLVGGGGNEQAPETGLYQDRLYLNDGKGNFTYDAQALPRMNTSTGAFAADDWDQDGDLDLYIGGRQVPGKYPMPALSHFLQNNNGRFVEVTEQIANDFRVTGMVTDAVFTNIDDDNANELIICGEWMSIRTFKYREGSFVETTTELGLEKTRGWWNCIIPADVDNDGDIDFLAGNLGLNTKFKTSPVEPFQIFAKDFDANGSLDIYLSYFTEGKCYPVRGRQCSSEQMPFIKKKFPSYNEFAEATIEDVLGEGINGALNYQTDLFESVILVNNGGTGFSLKVLPPMAQIAPINDAIYSDFDGDGLQDFLIAGNFHKREIETVRSDAGMGLLLKGANSGEFESVPPKSSGFRAWGDVRKLAHIASDKPGESWVLVAKNDDWLECFQYGTQNAQLKATRE